MKKFVIIAFIFALVAGAAFAQDGEWSVSGKGEIGTFLNFHAKQAKDNILFDRAGTLLVDNDKPYALIGANGYNNINWYGGIGGALGVRYNREGLSTGVDFQAGKLDGPGINATMSYSDDIRAFTVDYSLKNLFEGNLAGNHEFGRLWGYYKFLDGVIHLETAADSRDTNYWFSNDVVADLFAWSKVGDGIGIQGAGESMDFGIGFMKVDHHNYLAVDIAPASVIDGLSVGVMIPGVFAAVGLGDDDAKWQKYSGYTGYNQWGDGTWNAQRDNKYRPFLDETLLLSRLGVKFATGPIEIAGQFALLGRSVKQELTTTKPGEKSIRLADGSYKDVELKILQDAERKELKGNSTDDYYTDPTLRINTGLYLGAKFNVNDNLNAGIGFQGLFWSKTPELGFGANVGFNSGPFGANLLVGLYTHIDPTEEIVYVQKTSAANDKDYGEIKASGVIPGYEADLDKDQYVVSENNTVLGVKPRITFNIVENYLAASLETYLFWQLGLEQRAYRTDVFGYEVTPELWFNVMGTGAGAGYWWPNTTAIIVRYKIGGWINGKEIRTIQKTNKDVATQTSPWFNGVDVTFKWSF